MPSRDLSRITQLGDEGVETSAENQESSTMNWRSGRSEPEHESPFEKGCERSVLDRRHLLHHGVAAGMVIAASGLLLPEWLLEAEARAGALDGNKGGRRGHNRRGRTQKRTHGDRKDNQKGQDKPRGRDFFEMRKVAIAVHNYRSTAVRVRGWQPKDPPQLREPWEVPATWDWKELPAQSGSHHFSTAFVSARTRVAVQIGDTRVVYGENHHAPSLPSAAIMTGSWKETGSVGGQNIKEGTLWVNGSFFSGDIRITRVDDTDEHILFSVDLYT